MSVEDVKGETPGERAASERAAQGLPPVPVVPVEVAARLQRVCAAAAERQARRAREAVVS